MAREKKKKLPLGLWLLAAIILALIYAIGVRGDLSGLNPVEIFSVSTSKIGPTICRTHTSGWCENNIAKNCRRLGFVSRENCTRQGKICTVFMGVDAMCDDGPEANIGCDPRDHPSRCKGNVLEKCINRRWKGVINCNMGDGGVGGICIDYGNTAECSANPNSPPPPPSLPASPAAPAPANCSYVCLFNNKCAMLGGTQVSGACANGRICCSVDDDNTLPPPPSQPQPPTPSACGGDCVSGWKCTLFGGTKINGTCSRGVCCAGL